MNYDPKITLDNFSYPTTYTNDYRNYAKVDKRKSHQWPKDEFEKPKRIPPTLAAIDENTYQKWRPGVHLPFYTLWEPKPILEQDPYRKFVMPEKEIDVGKEEAMKTRPRRFISPAISMDDIPDPEMRKFVCDALYSNEWNRVSREAALPITIKSTKDTAVEIAGDPIGLYDPIYKPLPLGWKEKAKKWDHAQRRGLVDPTATFWIHKDPPVLCGACVDPVANIVSQEVKDEIASLLPTNELRWPHDNLMSTYAGHKPMLPYGIGLRQIDLPVTHPLLSTNQAAASRYKTDMKNRNK